MLISCQEPAESSKVKVKTEKAAKTKGDKGDKAKAKVSKDKLKSKAEKKPKAEKAEKLPKAQGPRDTLDWPKGLSSTAVINGHSRILKWRYLPHIRPIFQALISGNIPPKYGQKYGTNVPPSIGS